MEEYAKVKLGEYLDLIRMRDFHEKESTDGLCLYFHDNSAIVYTKDEMILEMEERHSLALSQLHDTIDSDSLEIKELRGQMERLKDPYIMLISEGVPPFVLQYDKLKWYQFRKVRRLTKWIRANV